MNSGRNERGGRATEFMQPPDRSRRDDALARRFVAGAVVLMVMVGLLAAFLATFAHGGDGTRAIATPTAGALASWSVAPHLVGEPVAPILAPSDPSVVYEAAVTGSNGEHVFRRSDDAGATWRDLPVPNDGGMSAYPFMLGGRDLWVDPANAKNVITTLARGLPEQYCPNQRVDVVCQLQYFSADGGEHWSKMQFPVPGSIMLTERVSQRTQAASAGLPAHLAWEGGSRQVAPYA